MIVESPESLKEWISNEVESLVDADPNAVAKYATALVQKDLSVEELKPNICSDLSVFLQEHTEKFVDKLFQVLEDKSYLGAADEEAAAVEEAAEASDSADSPGEADSDSRNRRRESKAASDDDLSDDDRDHRRRRSRSRSPQHNSGDANDRPLRRLSPHRRLGHRGGRGGPRGARRGGDIRSRLGGGRGAYRPDYGRRYENSGPPGGGFGGGGGRRRSRSPPGGGRRSLSPSARRHRSRSPIGRRTSLSPRPSNRSPVRDILSELTTSGSSKDNRPRCRDYDEKGYCLQGDLCKYSHGSDAVVMTDVSKLHLATSTAGSGASTGQQPIATLGSSSAAPGPMPPRMPPHRHVRPLMAPGAVHEPYNPEAPRMWRPPSHQQQVRPPPSGYMMNQQRGVYPVGMEGGPPPRMNARRGRGGYRPILTDANTEPLGGVRPPPVYTNRATLEVKNLPMEYNNIAKLNEHFSKFGTIINLQVRYEGHPDTALVTFSSNLEAKRAHTNPEPLFNNRFIKLFWHNPAGAAAAPGADASQTGGALSGLGPLAGPSSESIIPQQMPRVEPNMNPATLKLDNKKPPAAGVVQALPSRPSAPQPAWKQQQVERQKKTQSLLFEQIKQQKKLLAMVDKCKTAKEKSDLVEMIKTADLSINKLKADIARAKQAATAKEQTAKELLDTEIDLHQKQQSGEDTDALQAKLESLKEQATAMGIVYSGRGGRGRGRGRGGFPTSTRPAQPKTLVVMGFNEEEKDSVVSHFKGFGQLTELQFSTKPVVSVVVDYEIQNDAKVASIHGVKFNRKNLILKWYKPAVEDSSPVDDNVTISAKPQLTAPVSKDEEAELSEQQILGQEGESAEGAEDAADDLLGGDEDADGLDEALLLGDDDDDDDDEKKRSW